MATLKLNNTTVFTETNGAASIPSGVTIGNGVKFPAGHVLQIINTWNSTETYTTSSSYVQTNSSASITPSSSSSKILIIAANTLFWPQNGGTGAVATIYRDNTNIAPNDFVIRNYATAGGASVQMPGTIVLLDSPASTSSLTYTVRIKMVWGSGTIQWGSDSNEGEHMLLMEIAG